jgi:4-diphosphocytidyl-2-C-methyl-D-erythritol kinase
LIRAPAKLNLDLAIVGRLPDGRHALRSTVQAIDLADELELTEDPAITVDGFDAPAGEDNLAVKAMRAAGWRGGLRLLKRIPPGSGLGGASSDAAAVLRQLERPDLAPVLGADVAFFVAGGRQLMEAAGERLTPLPDEDAWYALAWPEIELSTKAVYDAYDAVGGDGRNHLFKAACSVEPALAEFARGLGTGWAMTGSGSAFFRECASRADAEAALAGIPGWRAVVRSLPAWGAPAPTPRRSSPRG